MGPAMDEELEVVVAESVLEVEDAEVAVGEGKGVSVPAFVGREGVDEAAPVVEAVIVPWRGTTILWS